ncbi:alpha/beta fold hydrolase [Paenibacillus mucilaginosus]|uniref:Alpha/beta hydrolase fold protein n=2 Tax=Paenibacillus mucilaginosus TaxID=61624 RepID=H6NH08_9BACL|nr:alpha/beta fold hydrolase [Paenibacillus mucilaginosus]AEI39721.1 alpha/beta hydrolase fold protein [Paenibacillus mucilaginosus KNP414]AFC28450.1 alpha/beta hydrolase fold protein [Paenibacillus mucilaginosus 3016]MCG7217418.1 alpha/beta fold hydrolase [Paenibacillus mucilaginosus]WDM29012.1 alpha/beta fold hydrolase [Paenibacillus mucilaginosus]WFA17247.1 alpha/beta fold hydrolase [Paenibacillus mucilaginosus]
MEYEIFDLGDVSLQSGVTLPNAFLAYKTYGILNEKKDNVIVYPTAFGDQHVQNEWLIGSGMALDPEKYFIIVPNLLGNGLSSSPSNTLPPFDRANFPQVTIYDNVKLQHRLITEKFGIQKIALVVGWSMGGIQAFQWGASYPEMVERIAPFAGIAKPWPHTFVVLNGMKAALLSAVGFDSNKQNQLTFADMRAVGRVYAGWGLSHAFYREELYREMGFDSLEDFVAGVWEDSFMKMDPHNVLAMLWTGQHADISANPLYNGDFDKALKSIRALACIMPGSTDLFCTADDNEYEAKLIPNAVFKPIPSIWGHFAGRGINSADNQFIDDNIKHLLARSTNG